MVFFEFIYIMGIWRETLPINSLENKSLEYAFKLGIPRGYPHSKWAK